MGGAGVRDGGAAPRARGVHLVGVERRLADQIAAATARGEDDDGRRYYRHWLAALEGLVVEKGLVADDELGARYDAWAEAAQSTPHGKPIVLPGR